MTKKHFIKIAAQFKSVVDASSTDQRHALYDVAGLLCISFRELNPAFDKARFMTACGF